MDVGSEARKLAGAVSILLLCLLWGPSSVGAAAKPAKALAEARELLDAGSPAGAVALLDELLAQRPDHSEALLLRSTGRFMLGETEAAKADLARSLAIDPKQRQGWLNQGAVAIAEERYPEALAAFEAAEKLDPEAPDNHLNIGVVLLLAGELTPASERFERYLSRPEADAESFYLVATNYALAGYAALAVEHLKQAVELDETARLRARTDPNFTAIANRDLQRLFATDIYRPPPGAYLARRELPVAYDAEDKKLLNAVLDTLQLSGSAFDPRVEVTPAWALIRGELRIKVTSTDDGNGLVEVSAPPDRLTPVEWRQRTEALFAGIAARLAG